MPSQRTPLGPPNPPPTYGYMMPSIVINPPNMVVNPSSDKTILDYYGQPGAFQGPRPMPTPHPYYGVDPMVPRPYNPQYNGQFNNRNNNNGQYPSEQMYGMNNQMGNLNRSSPPNYENPNYHYYINNGQNKWSSILKYNCLINN